MLTNEELNNLRRDIDHLDIDLLKLIAKRQTLCSEIGQYKIHESQPTRDLDREKDLIEKKIQLGKQLGLDNHFVHKLFEFIIDYSVRMQYHMRDRETQDNPKKYRVGYLGDQGSYSHQALIHYFEEKKQKVSAFGFKSFKDILNAVQTDTMDIGLLPIENTTSGVLLEVYDLLQGSGVHIIAEEIIEIEHCLIGQKESQLKKVKHLLGHPQAITQCSDIILQYPDWTIEYCTSSADALEEVIKRNRNDTIAIANPYAAKLYKLNILLKNISNSQQNFTRFILIGRQQKQLSLDIPAKVSIVFSTGQESGSLAKVLGCFQENAVRLTKLQSRPIPNRAWEELFYVDLEGHLEQTNVASAIQKAENLCRFLKILGCYASKQLERAKVDTKIN